MTKITADWDWADSLLELSDAFLTLEETHPGIAPDDAEFEKSTGNHVYFFDDIGLTLTVDSRANVLI